jgi:DNA damage-inducible protein 1
MFLHADHKPVFARVTMLYIPVTVNNYPVKAFVDSGAQTTIMSPSCAEACSIMRLIDRRYSGIAKGVGTAQILGRVHAADITIGTSTMSCSFTVMEGKDVDLLLGLDMLKRFQALIDLRRNVLVFGDDNEVSFLPEAEIPRRFEDAEPTIAGPGGTEIGATTGTVKPAGTSQAAAAAANQPQSGAQSAASSSIAASQPSNLARSAASPAPPVTAASTSKYSKETIAQLTTLGFTEAQAIQALDACDGNVEYAAGLLFGS